jgi:hypothetical protein
MDSRPSKRVATVPTKTAMGGVCPAARRSADTQGSYTAAGLYTVALPLGLGGYALGGPVVWTRRPCRRDDVLITDGFRRRTA